MLAILPAGGTAERFGGIHKELLPIGKAEYLLSNAVQRASELGAERFLVITSPEKAAVHERFLHQHIDRRLPITLVVRREQDITLWHAIRSILPFCEERNVLLLPDTTWTCDREVPVSDLAFGVFETNEAYRYSIITPDGVIRTKPVASKGLAWGCVAWSRSVADYWLWRESTTGPYVTYDEAFQDAMNEWGWQTWRIENYNDLGTWDAYQRYIKATMTCDM